MDATARCYLLSLLCAPCMWAIDWYAAPEGHTVDGDTVTASSNGASTPDRYLLTAHAFRDFVLSFTATRLPFEGERPRSIVVWGTAPETPQNRAAFFLNNAIAEVGRTYAFRFVVAGGQARAYCDGQLLSGNPSLYGTPLESGCVGFLHYYNYAYRYENVTLTALDAAALPVPSAVRAEISPAGCVQLQWNVPPGLADVLRCEVRRCEGDDYVPERSLTQAVVAAQFYTDRTCRSGSAYTYRISARLADGAVGRTSDPIRVKLPPSAPPKPPIITRCVRRIDDRVRVVWRLPEDSRVSHFSVVCADRPIAASTLAAAKTLAAGLPPAAGTRVTETPVGRYIAVVAHSPDGGQPGIAVSEPQPGAPGVAEGKPWPERHPMLLYDWGQVKLARRQIQQDATARQTADAVLRKADATVTAVPVIPSEPTDDHPAVSQARDVAHAYLLSGDDKYAAWVRDLMTGYARVYPTWPVHGAGRARMVKTASGLYEAVRYVPLLLAYDMTHDSPAYTDADHHLMEAGFLRPAVELFRVKDYDDTGDFRAQDLHYKCYNFQAWFIAAVGMTGLLLQDADMVEYAIDGPYGLKHLIAHDVHDDGVFWERSIGYHGFVIAALHPLLEAAWHCNLDLWHLRVPDDYNADRQPLANYCVGDGDNGPKSIKLMFDAPFYLMYGDRTYARIADSGQGPLRASDAYRTAWARYRDPKYAWLIGQETEARGDRPEHTEEQDAAADIRLAYDDTHLYLSADVTDDVVRNTHREPGDVWQGDALWFAIKWRGQRGGPYDFIYGLSPGDFAQTPPVPALFNRFSAVHGKPSRCRYAARATEYGYRLEAAFPLSELRPREGEDGTPLVPAEGGSCTVDFVLYDCDSDSGPSRKEKMVCWACVTDRYDSSQGGQLVFGHRSPPGGKSLSAARTPHPLTVDADPTDWEGLGSTPARIRPGAAVLTDADDARPNLHALFLSQPRDRGVFGLDGTSFCNNGVLQAGCSLYPSTGFAVLRERLDEYGRAPPDATCVTLNGGPHGGGHGHSDKLSIVLYADGRHWLPDFGSCAYGSPEKGAWTAQTVSHNTVVVDQTSQYPTERSDVQWPCDTAERQARSFVDTFHCTKWLKAARAHNDTVYKGVRMRRTVAVLGDLLIDFFEVNSPERHTYDYVLHVDGALSTTSVPLSAPGASLGESGGYQFVTGVRRGETTGPLSCRWASGRTALDIAMAVPGAGADTTQLIVAEGITNTRDASVPVMIARRRAQSTVFATVLQPLRDAQSPAEITWVRDGTDGVVALHVRREGRTELVVFNPTGTDIAVDGFRSNAPLALRTETADGRVTKHTVP